MKLTMRISSISLLLLVTLLSCSLAGEWEPYHKFYTKMINTKGDTYSFIVNAILNGAKVLYNSYFRPNQQDIFKCLLDLSKFHEGLHNKEMWALKMFDASSQFPSGFLKGNTMQLGNFKECINIENKVHNITGTSCFVYFSIPDKNLPITSNFFSIGNSVCIPKSCSPIHLQTILYNSPNMKEFIPAVSYCQNKDSMKLPVGSLELIILVSFGILGTILFISTGYDILLRICTKDSNTEHSPLIEHGKDLAERLRFQRSVLSFSLLENAAALFKPDTGSKSIKCLYGLRFISACFIISIHRILLDPQPFSNAFLFETEMRHWYRAVQLNAYVFVDVFFVMSGLLISYKYSSCVRGKLRLFHYYIHRYIRLTPPLLVCVMLELISPMFCDGPYCEPVIHSARQRCLDNAIYTLTYINNFINPSKKCLLHSWYLSADMQMYFLAPILILLMKKWRRSIGFILPSCLAASILSTFIISYMNNLKASYLGDYEFYETDSKLVYEPFYTRAGPWIIGFSLGILLQSYNKEPYRLKKRTLTIGWIIALAGILVALFGIYPFVQRSFVHDRITDSLYKSFHRNLFGLGCAWIIYVCYTGQSELLNQILSSPVLQPLGKVSYCLYVVHPFVQMLQYRNLSSNRKYSDFLQGSLTIGDISYSVVFAIFLHLAVEAPTLKLENIFLSSLRENSKTKEEERLEMFKSNSDEKGQV